MGLFHAVYRRKSRISEDIPPQMNVLNMAIVE